MYFLCSAAGISRGAGWCFTALRLATTGGTRYWGIHPCNVRGGDESLQVLTAAVGTAGSLTVSTTTKYLRHLAAFSAFKVVNRHYSLLSSKQILGEATCLTSSRFKWGCWGRRLHLKRPWRMLRKPFVGAQLHTWDTLSRYRCQLCSGGVQTSRHSLRIHIHRLAWVIAFLSGFSSRLAARLVGLPRSSPPSQSLYYLFVHLDGSLPFIRPVL